MTTNSLSKVLEFVLVDPDCRPKISEPRSINNKEEFWYLKDLKDADYKLVDESLRIFKVESECGPNNQNLIGF